MFVYDIKIITLEVNSCMKQNMKKIASQSVAMKKDP